jgi:hypothetical protein
MIMDHLQQMPQQRHDESMPLDELTHRKRSQGV